MTRNQGGRRQLRRAGRVGALLVAGLSLAGCADDPTREEDPPSGEPGVYVLSSLFFGPDTTTTYVSLLESLEPQTLDYDRAREFPGAADAWVHDGSVLIADAESQTITRYSVADGQLVEEGRVSFASYGLTDFGFWLNKFVSPTKAYFLNGTAAYSEYIAWDPSAMQITGTLDLPAPEERDGFKIFPGYSDRAAVVRDGLLYQPFYWTDDSFFRFAPQSRIAVFDVGSDELVDVIEAPCPGLDYVTVDEDGDLLFSRWIFAAGGAAVLDQPATCAFEIPSDGSAPSIAFEFADVSGGREGAALRWTGGDRAILSVLHHERVALGKTTDPAEVTFGANWRFWSYDGSDGTASLIDAIDWNAGAQYSFDIDQRTFMLVALGDYSATTVYDLGDGMNPQPMFETRGWALRLFKLE